LKTKILLILLATLLLILFPFSVRLVYAYDYYIQADFADYTPIPVNIESTLSATIKRTDGQPATGTQFAVEITFQWGGRNTFYSDPNTGKVTFKVKPTYSGVQTITFKSTEGAFADYTAYVKCVPGIVVEVLDPDKSKVQFIDPLSRKDIAINVRAKETAAWSYVSVPSRWEVSVIPPSGAPPDTSVYVPPVLPTNSTGIYEVVGDINNDYLGRYTLTVKAYYSDYYVLPTSFTVDIRQPVVATKYSFQTGESLTIIPGVNTGQSIEIKPNCKYFDVEFTDARGNPLNVAFSSIDVEIESPSGVKFSRTNGYVKVEQLADNKIRAYFTLAESWYIIRLKSLTGGVAIGTYFVPLDQNYIKVATVSTGFRIWDFITNPWVFIPLGIIIFFLFIRLISRREKKVEE